LPLASLDCFSHTFETGKLDEFFRLASDENDRASYFCRPRAFATSKNGLRESPRDRLRPVSTSSEEKFRLESLF